MFSSLEGFKFNWKMTIDKETVPAAQILKLKEEKKEASITRLNIEEEFFSDIILLRGIKIQIKANKLKGRFKYIKLVVDYSNYSWSLPNNDCGKVDEEGNYMSLKECNTEITAFDKRIDNFNFAKALIFNVIPTKMDLGLYEIENFNLATFKLAEFDKIPTFFSFLSQWELVVDNFYVIKNFLFYDTHPINDENNKIKYTIGNGDYNKYFDVIECNEENKFCVVKSKMIKEENFEINSEMVEKKFPIKKFVKIFSKIKIEKYGQKKFILPYLGYETEDYTLISQELKLNVIGGTHRYIYHSENQKVIKINNEIIFGQNIGQTVKFNLKKRS